MTSLVLIAVLLLLMSYQVKAGTQCPGSKNIFPCSCTNLDNGFTLVVCPNIHNTSHLEEVTRPMKSMIIDRLMLLNTFADSEQSDDSINAVDPKTKFPLHGMFPKKWLAEVRVRDLEIQNGNVNGYFLIDDALEGQSDFLTSLVIKNANLSGHVCSSCGPASGTIAMATSELRRTPNLKYVDFSYNQLEILDGGTFPPQLKELNKIVLSNNQISRVHDNAFSNLQQLNHLDLSRNRIKALSRKIFKSPDLSLNIIDLSYNSIHTLPEDIFHLMSALKEVKLSHNLLETLPSNTWLKLPTLLEKVELRGNFLVCNCSLNWISRRLSSKITKVIGQCIAPKPVEFQDIKPNLAAISNCS
ncbi:uncharacterized protein TNCT_342671 [Trichonephila clavata]|uniref:Uncharacterized protein n=1 Tax=Trichonephila clavata TaxID=2740835 RepID=A0A8X6J6S0_TRICU|nr:uncharacterized protein TNCT_342671 [Trichonephila clavata]